MNTVRTLSITTLATSLLLLAGCSSASAPKPSTPAAATTDAATPAQPTAEAKVPVITASSDAKHTWNTEQILTCTVSQCWQLGGRTEDGYFDIIQQLAIISAQNRGLTLPDTDKAGRDTGEYIKAQAHKDRQQLLYAVVDAAIRKVGAPAAQTGAAQSN
jgi:hypothetical protein